jgi:hypothetical protein
MKSWDVHSTRQLMLLRLMLEVWPAAVAIEWRDSITTLTDSISVRYTTADTLLVFLGTIVQKAW